MTHQNLTRNIKVFRKTDLIILQAVADGTKPAALIRDIYEQEIKESGLYYQKYPFDQFVVAKTKEKVDEICELSRRFGELHEELGLKLGYPATAVQAFLGKIETKGFDEMRVEYDGFFTFSKDHFADEIKVIGRWYESAKKKFDSGMVQ